MCGEDNEIVQEDAGPDAGNEEDYACLGDYCCACLELSAGALAASFGEFEMLKLSEQMRETSERSEDIVTYDEVIVERSAFLLRRIACSAEKWFILPDAFYLFSGNSYLWNACC